MNEVNREVQSRGWHFNTEYNVELIPDTSKHIEPPVDAVRVDVENIDTVIRNNKLFRLDTRKNTFEDKVKAQIIYLQDFEVMPEPARRYVATRAARIYSDRMLNSESMNRFLVKDEQSALIDLKEFEGDTANTNTDSYSVARVLNRTSKDTVMSMISSAIPNLVQGISQQSPALRLSSQAELQENAFPSLAEGLHKRPPLEFVTEMKSTPTTGNFSHLINRDTTERYFVFINASNQIEVYDLAGNAKTVTYPDGTSHLTTSSPQTAFRAVTVADYTFIVNTEKTVSMSSQTSPVYPYTGLISVKQGDYNQRYTAYIDGSVAADITTSATDQVQTRTDDIANRLATAVNGASGITATNNGSTVVITKSGNATFDLATYDSLGDTGLSATVGTVQRFDDLPAKHQMVILPTYKVTKPTTLMIIIKIASDNGSQSTVVTVLLSKPLNLTLITN